MTSATRNDQWRAKRARLNGRFRRVVPAVWAAVGLYTLLTILKTSTLVTLADISELEVGTVYRLWNEARHATQGTFTGREVRLLWRTWDAISAIATNLLLAGLVLALDIGSRVEARWIAEDRFETSE